MTGAGFQDREIFYALLQHFDRDKSGTAGERILALGRYFLNAPYAAGTLEKAGTESLVVNLRQFDCFTFVEHCIALMHLFSSRRVSFARYREILTFVRYRRGRLDGYASRLHYFSDWLFDNQRKGIVKNISFILGGQPLLKKIHFMTGHPDQYPALKDHAVYRQMRTVEKRMQRRVRHYIPKAALKKMGGRIADGDLIAVTARIEGLDVIHAGIAVHVGQRLHLLHASSHAGCVLVSTETLDRYLAGNKACSGIMVARINEHACPSP
ncbi:MAG: N-acetylmuramoyl-L-alanine amidase-like domain-containing protein [Pseudomonadota bacterium]